MPLQTSQAHLIPTFHKAYWIGVQTDTPKSFSTWLDTLVRPPFNSSQKHWGISGASLQPDNAGGQELCAVANASMAYGKPSSWGWADTGCTDRFIFMCRMIRERAALASCAGCLGPSGLNKGPHTMLSHLAGFGALVSCGMHACRIAGRPPATTCRLPYRGCEQALVACVSPAAGVDPNAMLADKGLAALLTLSGQTVNATYFFNLQPLSFIAAESYCTDRGGHLVSWSR